MDVSDEESKNQVATESKGLDLNSLNLAPQGQGFLESLWLLVGKMVVWRPNPGSDISEKVSSNISVSQLSNKREGYVS